MGSKSIETKEHLEIKNQEETYNFKSAEISPENRSSKLRNRRRNIGRANTIAAIMMGVLASNYITRKDV